MKYKFSIVTPTFRQLDWLRLCIASVRNQVVATPSTLSIEHIIQDAGTLGIEELARELGAEFYRDGQFVFGERKQARDAGRETSTQQPKPANEAQAHYSLKIFSEKDTGMYDAINRGLARSAGGICAWLNSDEQYLPETLSKVAEIFQQQKKLDILLGDAILLNSSLEPICYRRIMVPSLWHTRLVHLHSLSCAMFFKKSALPNPPLNPRWKVISDAVLMEHFLMSRKNIHTCKLPLAAYAFTGQNLSADKNCNELEQWWAETRWPPRVLKPLVVNYNRFRRLLAGAYQSFEMNAKIHTSTGYKSLKGSVSGLWPSQ
ncbi:MAG: glycosyltransferase [Proteobacteria bacterium]|nr:glycosyltransferase [Pseudomonadota bacterium]